LKQFTQGAGFMIAAALAVVLGAASVAGMADAGQPEVAPSGSINSTASSEIAAATYTGFPFDDPTFHPGTTSDMFAPTPTPGPATPTPAPTAKPTPVPTPRDTVWNAKIYAKNALGATQYACLDRIFTYESKWNPTAGNPDSGAYGIPQALPGSKMAKFGANWRYSPLIQVKWGIWYVNNRYGSACAAWAHIVDSGWY